LVIDHAVRRISRATAIFRISSSTRGSSDETT